MAVRIATFERGGTFHVQGSAIAELALRLGAFKDFGEVEVLETPTASIGNARRLDSGDADFGFVAANLIGRAARGETPFTQPIAVRVVGPANVGPVFFVARADSTLQTIDDLRGKRVAVGPAANAMRNNVKAMLTAAGFTGDDYEPVELDFSEGAEALIDARVDAQVQPPIPNAVMNRLAAAIEVRVLEYGPGQLDRVLRALPLFRCAVVPEGAFPGLKNESEQLGVFNVIASHVRVANGRVAAMAELLCSHCGDLAGITPLFAGLPALFDGIRQQGIAALEVDGVTLHPAAVAAYQKLGMFAS